MALIPVRSKEPINGETFVTEVGQEHLERWPEDYVPLEGEELVRYELKKAGVPDEHIEQAVENAVALLAAAEQVAAEVAADQAPGDATASDETPGDEPSTPTSTPAGVDPSASAD